MAFVNLMTLAYPVGSYYISKSNTNPAQHFGGTWVEIVAGAFLRSVGSGNTATSNPATVAGGSETVTLTQDQIPSHNHTYTIPGHDSGSGWYGANGTAAGASQTSGNTGGGQPHNNLPPYVNVHIFYRSA